MQRYLYTLLFVALCGFVFGQQPADFCGSHQGRSAWLKDYQLKPNDFAKGGDTTLYVALSIHILGSDEGIGYYSIPSLMDAFCLLNELYLPSGIQFFIEGDINYINNTAYYSHETILEGGEMMFTHNIPNTFNCYFVSDPAGNCGYNLPYAGCAVGKSCAGATDITWAHEIGHGLSLPHPFLGWEGGVEWDGSVEHSFSDPAPFTVTYDYTFFQDTLILDTLIIDTAFVELVNGSNCTIAADGFCDTAPDYLASRWTCNNEGVSGTIQTDPNGETFQSDGSLVMNYANDACQVRFSPDQQQAMRAFLLSERAHWLYDQSSPVPLSTMPATLTLPEDGALVPANLVELSWEAVPGASSYLVEISRLAGFQGALTDSYVTTDNSFLAPTLLVDRAYYWRVSPFNRSNTCAEPSDSRSFLTDAEVATHDIASLDHWLVYPNPVKGNKTLHFNWTMNQQWSGQIGLYNTLGQAVKTQRLDLQTGNNQLNWDLTNVSSGIYFVRMENNASSQAKRIVVY